MKRESAAGGWRRLSFPSWVRLWAVRIDRSKNTKNQSIVNRHDYLIGSGWSAKLYSVSPSSTNMIIHTDRAGGDDLVRWGGGGEENQIHFRHPWTIKCQPDQQFNWWIPKQRWLVAVKRCRWILTRLLDFKMFWNPIWVLRAPWRCLCAAGVGNVDVCVLQARWRCWRHQVDEGWKSVAIGNGNCG